MRLLPRGLCRERIGTSWIEQTWWSIQCPGIIAEHVFPQRLAFSPLGVVALECVSLPPYLAFSRDTFGSRGPFWHGRNSGPLYWRSLACIEFGNPATCITKLEFQTTQAWLRQNGIALIQPSMYRQDASSNAPWSSRGRSRLPPCQVSFESTLSRPIANPSLEVQKLSIGLVTKMEKIQARRMTGLYCHSWLCLMEHIREHPGEMKPCYLAYQSIQIDRRLLILYSP